jgi:hypothetical protein
MRNKLLLTLGLIASMSYAQSPTDPKGLAPGARTDAAPQAPQRFPTKLADAPGAKPGDKPESLAKVLVPAPTKAARSSQLVEDERVASELARIENEINLMKAQAELAGSEAKLRSLRGDTRSPNGVPTLVGITGTTQRLTAKLQYDGQHILYVRVGDVLPSGYELQTLSTSRATIRKGNEMLVLPLVYARQLAPTQTAVQTSPTVPIDSAGPIVGRNTSSARQ